MTTTYLNDESFFSIMWMPGHVQLALDQIEIWSNENIAKFRFIHDTEMKDEWFTLSQIQSFYPGIKTIAVVHNPWERTVFLYEHFNEVGRVEPYIKDVEASTFELFVANIHNSLNDPKNWPHWFNLSTAQTNWTEQTLPDGTIQQADYIIKIENLAEEFQPLADYFCRPAPDFSLCYTPIDYRPYYNEKTKQTIAELFKTDIERFGYTF